MRQASSRPLRWARIASVCRRVVQRVAQVERDLRPGSSLPASIFEKSRMSLMTVKQRVGRALDEAEVLALLGASRSVSSASSVMPMMPFIGVRISWLMLARNSLLRGWRPERSRRLPSGPFRRRPS